jgi:hypothetical protein
MFPCPHCHKPIEIGIAPNGKVPWYKLDPGNAKVSLGCGTLLLIGIIVALCSGGVSDEALQSLRQDIQRLERKIDSLTPAETGLPADVKAAKRAK